MNDIIPPGKPGQELTVSRATSLERPRSGNITTSIQLTSFHDILDFADQASRSGLIPEKYRGKPADIVIAVMHGAELGLPPIQAINSIAVINGRPSVWGDAVPGLCYGSGLAQDIEEYYEGEPGTDGFTAVCVATRRGFSPKTGRFSQGDAKTAGLYGKATHGSYPKRMMMWRARHFALHDAFPDVLRGIGTRELEAEDEVSNGPKWSMPQPERAAFASRPALAASDGWDNTWFEGVQNKLIAEPNAWKWMEILLAAIKEAPTLRDLEEIGDLRNVREARANAPDEARRTIDTAWVAAQERFKAKLDDAYVPGGAKAPPADPARIPAVVEKMMESHDAVRRAREIAEREEINEPDPFDVVLVDQHGEIHGEYNDARSFALDFMALWQKLNDAEDGKAIEALCDYNADAIDHARSIDKSADHLMQALDDDAAANAAVIQIVEPPADRGKPSWTGYVGLIKQALEKRPPDLAGWVEAQRPTLEKCPMAQRAVAVRAISAALGANPIPWLGDLIRPKAKPDKPAAKEAEKPAEKAAEKPVEAPADPDERWVGERIVELATIDEAGFNEMIKSTVVRTVMARLRRDKPALFARADEKFSDKYNAFLAAKGA